ncbi:hypothetical protein LI205_03840 [bacterium MSK18_59]|nr:hypothetical protein [bacterium MSK18_59]
MNLFNTTSLPQNIKKCEHITSPEYDKHAERKARWSSDDFRKATDVVVQKINLDQGQVVLIANTGA